MVQAITQALRQWVAAVTSARHETAPMEGNGGATAPKVWFRFAAVDIHMKVADSMGISGAGKQTNKPKWN